MFTGAPHTNCTLQVGRALSDATSSLPRYWDIFKYKQVCLAYALNHDFAGKWSSVSGRVFVVRDSMALLDGSHISVVLRRQIARLYEHLCFEMSSRIICEVRTYYRRGRGLLVLRWVCDMLSPCSSSTSSACLIVSLSENHHCHFQLMSPHPVLQLWNLMGLAFVS